MGIFQYRDRFQFYQYFSFNDKIGAARTNWLWQFFVENVLLNFTRKSQPRLCHLKRQGPLINYLLEAIAQKFMHIKGRPDDFFGYIFMF